MRAFNWLPTVEKFLTCLPMKIGVAYILIHNLMLFTIAYTRLKLPACVELTLPGAFPVVLQSMCALQVALAVGMVVCALGLVRIAFANVDMLYLRRVYISSAHAHICVSLARAVAFHLHFRARVCTRCLLVNRSFQCLRYVKSTKAEFGKHYLDTMLVIELAIALLTSYTAVLANSIPKPKDMGRTIAYTVMPDDGQVSVGPFSITN